MQPPGVLEIVCRHIVGIDLPGRRLAPVKDELTAAVAGIGDKGHPGGAVGQHLDVAGVDALLGETIEDAATEAVRPDCADKAAGMTKTRHGIDVHGGIAAGIRPGKRADLVERLVQTDTHDLDQHSAQRDNGWIRRHGLFSGFLG